MKYRLEILPGKDISHLVTIVEYKSILPESPSRHSRKKKRKDPLEHRRYVYLGKTTDYGTRQLEGNIVRTLTRLVEQSKNGLRVNSVFGEGVNPRLRKVRDGLDALGFPSDRLLIHGSQRLVYGVPLARNFREYLLGIDEQPDYYLPTENPQATTRQIVNWWAERWLAPRLRKEEVLERVAKHTLVYPIQHGARVPQILDDPDQLVLFDQDQDSDCRTD